MGEVVECLRTMMSQMKEQGDAQLKAQLESTAALLELTAAQRAMTAALLELKVAHVESTAVLRAGLIDVRDDVRDTGDSIREMNHSVNDIGHSVSDIGKSVRAEMDGVVAALRSAMSRTSSPPREVNISLGCAPWWR